MRHFRVSLLFAILLLMACQDKQAEKQASPSRLPNIIIIYADDLGFGDVGAYGSKLISTPNLDRLAVEGRRFTDAHAPSATCTPSRFGLLTGMYPWRNKRARILSGTAPLLIDTAQSTVASMLKTQGYRTGIVGKWHLGLGDGNVNWNATIAPGPNELGFDYSHILAATQDRVPTVYIENGKVVNLDPDDPIEVSYEENFEGEPTGVDNPELLTMKWHHGHNNSIVNGIGRIGYMKGGKSALWSDIDMADHFLEKALAFIEGPSEPFFLYYALQQPHVPRTPHPRFAGSTSLGPRGDVIVEADWCIGQLITALGNAGKLENTLIIVSSDNGPVLNDGYYDDAAELNSSHTPWGPYRGGKYSLFEAGTRVPFITFWKGRITPGVSDALVSHLDIYSSLAQLTGSPLRGPDSEEMLGLFLGESEKGREHLVVEAIGRTALRLNHWKYIPVYEGNRKITNVNIETGVSDMPQLYNLGEDPSEMTNLSDRDPDMLKTASLVFETIISEK